MAIVLQQHRHHASSSSLQSTVIHPRKHSSQETQNQKRPINHLQRLRNRSQHQILNPNGRKTLRRNQKEVHHPHHQQQLQNHRR